MVIALHDSQHFEISEHQPVMFLVCCIGSHFHDRGRRKIVSSRTRSLYDSKQTTSPRVIPSQLSVWSTTELPLPLQAFSLIASATPAKKNLCDHNIRSNLGHSDKTLPPPFITSVWGSLHPVYPHKKMHPGSCSIWRLFPAAKWYHIDDNVTSIDN